MCVIANPRVPVTHSRRILALWLITFVGVLIQLGMSAPDLPSQLGDGAQAADLHVAPGADRSGEQPAPDEQHHHVLAHGLGGRISPAQQRTARSLSVGLVAGCVLAAAATGGSRAGGGPAHPWVRWRTGRRWAGARLLIRLCRART